MALSNAICEPQLEIQQKLVQQDLGGDANDERGLAPRLHAPHDLATTLKTQLLGVIERFKNKSSNAMKDSTRSPRTVQLEDMPNEPSSCKYSPHGEYLAFLSAEKIVTYNVSEVLCENVLRLPQCREIIGRARWSGFDLCSKYLVAFTNSTFLDLYIYPLSPPSQTAPETHIFREDMSPIKKISLSPDGEYLVMVLQNNGGPCSIYLRSIRSLIENVESREPQRRRQSLDPINPEIMTGFNISHVESVQFSKDSRLVVLLSQPIGSNSQVFSGWSRNEASSKYEYVNSITFTLPGIIDTSETWLTAFIPLMHKLSILKVTFQHAISQSSFTRASKDLNWTSQELKGVQILDILPLSPDDQHCIFIGREFRNRGNIKALYAEVSSLRNNLERLHFDFVLDLGYSDWVPGRDSASTLSNGEIFLVATPNEFITKVFRLTEKVIRYTHIRPQAHP